MAQKSVKLHGKTSIAVSTTGIEAQYMERNKYYIRKGGKSIVRADNITLNSKTVEVTYLDSGQKRKWPKTTIVFEVLDTSKVNKMKRR